MVGTVSNIRGAVDNTAKAAQNVAEQAEAITQYSEKLSDVLSRFKLRADDAKENKSHNKALVKPKRA
jgi:ABC-type transporter Mla subunit MlaD